MFDNYLTDEQYLDLLRRARKRLDLVKDVWCEDSVDVGFKHTKSNVGLCNNGLTTKGIALFPREFPGRREMKYRGWKHKCPLDGRKKVDFLGWGFGCFFGCLLFKSHLGDLGVIKRLYDEQIRLTEKEVKI